METLALESFGLAIIIFRFLGMAFWVAKAHKNSQIWWKGPLAQDSQHISAYPSTSLGSQVTQRTTHDEKENLPCSQLGELEMQAVCCRAICLSSTTMYVLYL